MNELCILQDDVPPFPNQVKTYSTENIIRFHMLVTFMRQIYGAGVMKTYTCILVSNSTPHFFRSPLR